MPGRPHIPITESIYQCLPERERAFWKKPSRQLARYCLLPDNPFDELFSEYCLLPDGNPAPHGPTDEKFTRAPFAPYYNRESFRCLINAYFPRLVKEIAAGNQESSFILACVLAHFMEDNSHPIHAIDNRLVYQYLPPPQGKYWQLHRPLDDAPADPRVLRKARPRLLGVTAPEAVFHTISQYEKMLFACRSRFVPLVQAFYRNDRAGMKRIINQCFLLSAELCVSIWHTAFCLAERKFAPEDVGLLARVMLTDIVPAYEFTVDPYFFAPLYGFDCDEQGNLVPLSLGVKKGNRIAQAEFRHGIAMSFGYVGYEIPVGVYRTLTARVGLSGMAGQADRISFKVIRSGQPPVYADFHVKLLDCGGPVLYDSGVMTKKDSSREVDVPLKDAAHFTLVVEFPDKPEYTHAIWAEPVLLK